MRSVKLTVLKCEERGREDRGIRGRGKGKTCGTSDEREVGLLGRSAEFVAAACRCTHPGLLLG